MGRADHYVHGDHNAICDRCGQKTKFSQLKKTWDGLWVCSKHWEQRHPQDFVRGVVDQQAVEITRPESADSFLPHTWTAFPQLQDPTRDTAYTYDSTVRVVNYNKTYADSTTPVETIRFTFSKVLADSSTVGEALTRIINGNRAFTESVVETDSTITFTFITGTVLNGTSLNTIKLG